MSRALLATLILLLMTGYLLGVTTVSDAKVLAAWLFDEEKGKVAEDATGSGFDLKVVRGEWTKGKGAFGGALNFADVGTYAAAKVPTVDFNFSKGEFTILSRINLTAITDCCTGIPSWGVDNISGDWAGKWPSGNTWVLHPDKRPVGKGDYFTSFWYNSQENVDGQPVGQDAGWTAIHTGAVNWNEWHQFAITFDGTELKIFADGELQDIANTVGPHGWPQGAPVELSFSRDLCCGAPRTHTGWIDEALLADEAISEELLKKSSEVGIAEIPEFQQAFAVSGRDKLVTTWARLKRRY